MYFNRLVQTKRRPVGLNIEVAIQQRIQAINNITLSLSLLYYILYMVIIIFIIVIIIGVVVISYEERRSK